MREYDRNANLENDWGIGSMEEQQRLTQIASELRRDALTLIYRGGDGHPGPTLGVADIVTALYYSVMRIDPARPE